MLSQLEYDDSMDRLNQPFHKAVVEESLPYSIGGGIGQSRLCMYFLRKAHIGEVQASVWSEEMIKGCEDNNIFLL
jgi:aspartate--ammonia ligase